MFELSSYDLGRLRERLTSVGYTVDGVHRLLGESAHAALHRNETTPGLRVTTDRGPLATLVRLWLLQEPVPAADAERALPDLLEPLVTEQILHRYGSQVCALVDVRPYAAVQPDGSAPDWWVVADLTPGMDGERPTVGSDHVLGVNSAATTLAQLTVRAPVERALDLGTGCGAQALHLASHARQIVGTDVNPRALALARLTVDLNDIAVDLRAGSRFDPVEGERFDLIVSNPPFVISPRDDLIYRDSELAGDEFCRRLVVEAPRHLVEGGVCQLLANWLHIRREDWRDRLATWLARTGCDAWIVQREVSDPAAYAEVWLKDAGVPGAAGYRERYDEWLAWFEAQAVEGIGYGWITLRRTTSAPVVRIEDWPHAVEQPLAPAIARWLDDAEALRGLDDTGLLGLRLVVAGDVDQEQVGRPGAADPEHLVLRQRQGFRRAVRVDTAEAGLVGACDGTLAVGQIVDALASLLGEDADSLRARLLSRVRELIADGFVRPERRP